MEEHTHVAKCLSGGYLVSRFIILRELVTSSNTTGFHPSILSGLYPIIYAYSSLFIHYSFGEHNPGARLNTLYSTLLLVEMANIRRPQNIKLSDKPPVDLGRNDTRVAVFQVSGVEA